MLAKTKQNKTKHTHLHDTKHNKQKKKKAKDFPGDPVVKHLPSNSGDMGSVPIPGRFHMLQNKETRVPRLLSLCSRAPELHLLRLHAATLKP